MDEWQAMQQANPRFMAWIEGMARLGTNAQHVTKRRNRLCKLAHAHFVRLSAEPFRPITAAAFQLRTLADIVKNMHVESVNQFWVPNSAALPRGKYKVGDLESCLGEVFTAQQGAPPGKLGPYLQGSNNKLGVAYTINNQLEEAIKALQDLKVSSKEKS
jgi:hypothetical protein